MKEKVLLQITADEYGVGCQINADNDKALFAVSYVLCAAMCKNRDFGDAMMKTIHKLLQPGHLEQMNKEAYEIPTDFDFLLKEEGKK